MSEFKKGIFIGKFYPLHMGHISTLRELSKKSEEAYLVFYYDAEAEKRLADQLGIDYNIKRRVDDAKEAVKFMGNVSVKIVTVPPEITFPKDFLKIKLMVQEQIQGEADVQIFGEEEEAIYLPFKYTDSYLLGPSYEVKDEHGNVSSLHATAVRNNYSFYRKYLPVEVRNSLG